MLPPTGDRRGADVYSSAILFAVIGLLTGLLGGIRGLVAATCGALVWGLAAGWMAQKTLGQVALGLLFLLVTLQAAFLVGLALRTLTRR
jgi:hypothetical protein